MKKVILCAAVAFAAVAGTVCYNSDNRNENEMSDLAKANVKALAEEVSKSCCLNYYIWECSVDYWNVGCVCGL